VTVINSYCEVGLQYGILSVADHHQYIAISLSTVCLRNYIQLPVLSAGIDLLREMV